MMRRGLTKGSGKKGYYNVIGSDPRVHSNSAKGIKMPQRMPMLHGGKRKVVKEYEVFNYDELPEDVKQKALENYYDINVDGDFWYDYDEKLGLNAEEVKKYGTDKIFDEGKRLYFDIDRGQYIQFPDLKVVNEEGFRKFLGLPKSLWKKVKEDDYSFESEREYNTRLKLGTYMGDYSEKEEKLLRQAEEKFADKVHEAWKNLRDTYEDQTSKEAIEDTFRANEYEFTSDGKLH